MTRLTAELAAATARLGTTRLDLAAITAEHDVATAALAPAQRDLATAQWDLLTAQLELAAATAAELAATAARDAAQAAFAAERNITLSMENYLERMHEVSKLLASTNFFLQRVCGSGYSVRPEVMARLAQLPDMRP